MFQWFRSSSPVDPVTRDWIDRRWRWLTGEFGSDFMIDSPTVLPTAEFFPDAYDRSSKSVRALLERVCGYMGVEPSRVEFEFFSNANLPTLVNEEGHALAHAAGTFEEGDSRSVIRIETWQFDEPMLLAGTVAHELAHVRLLGEGRLSRDEFDNELLTDLTVVFHGLGIFPANCPRHWHSAVTTWPGTTVPRPKYMTTPMYGYALAFRCWLREEPLPRWRKHLNPGLRAEFKQAMRFLNGLTR
jgi:hypothetical protein